VTCLLLHADNIIMMKILLPVMRTSRSWQRSVASYRSLQQSGSSRVTAGPRETFSRGPQTFSRDPSGKKFFEFVFQNGTFWHTLYFWPTVGPPNVAEPRVANRLSHFLDGPGNSLPSDLIEELGVVETSWRKICH